ncbi:MAG: hypothetical protein ACRECH_07250 [Nitrososphaerales archaeon]
MKQAKGKVVDRGHGGFKRIFLYIPSHVFNDTTFPFTIGEDVDVIIQDKEALLIKKRKRKQD